MPPPEDEQGEASRGNTTPNVRPRLELWRLQLKPWYESHFPIAGTTWPIYKYVYLHTVP